MLDPKTAPYAEDVAYYLDREQDNGGIPDAEGRATVSALAGILQQVTRIADMLAAELERDRQMMADETADETPYPRRFCSGCVGAGTGAWCCICGGPRLRATDGA